MANIQDLSEVRKHLIRLYEQYGPRDYEDEYSQGIKAGIEVCVEHVDSMIEHEDQRMDRYHMALRTVTKRD